MHAVAPADAIDPDYGEALRSAADAGVELFALGARVTARAIVIEIRAPRSKLPAARERVIKLLAGLAAHGLDAADRKRGRVLARQQWQERHADPAERLASLWRGEPPGQAKWEQPSEARWRGWLAKTLRADRLIIVTEEQDAK